MKKKKLPAIAKVIRLLMVLVAIAIRKAAVAKA
jgi:hypothetical protein